MPDIKDILKNEDFGSIVGDLCVDTRENRNPREYMEEYNGDRTRRKESVGYREPKKIAVYSDTEVEIDPETIGHDFSHLNRIPKRPACSFLE